jgi:hypothetical protein
VHGPRLGRNFFDACGARVWVFFWVDVRVFDGGYGWIICDERVHACWATALGLVVLRPSFNLVASIMSLHNVGSNTFLEGRIHICHLKLR